MEMKLKILEVKQGYYKNLSGCKLSDVLAEFESFDRRMMEKAEKEGWKRYPSIWYMISEYDTRDKCPWGWHWYLINGDGTIKLYQEHLDSSG
jgi:hypothetical protein